MSVIVPVFGDAIVLDELVTRVLRTLEALRVASEVIVVNDGSPSSTWSVISAIATREPRVKAINLHRNFGQQNALLAGIRASSGEAIVTIDDDLQHPPEEIPTLLNALSSADLVYGVPIERVRRRTRDLSSVVSKALLASVFGARHATLLGAFRAFRGSLARAFATADGPHVSIDVLLSWTTTRIVGVPVRYEPRRHGRSGYGIARLAGLTINMVTGFSTWPLRMASVVGLGFSAFGLLVLAYVIIRFLTAGRAVPGFAFLASVIAIFAGAQLLTLGIMGEYLARMYQRMMSKPAYVVESTINLTDQGRA